MCHFPLIANLLKNYSVGTYSTTPVGAARIQAWIDDLKEVEARLRQLLRNVEDAVNWSDPEVESFLLAPSNTPLHDQRFYDASVERGTVFYTSTSQRLR